MEYLIVGPTIINDIYRNGICIQKEQLGGAIYALQGALIWNTQVGYVSNVGDDFMEYYGNWMSKNQVLEKGQFKRLAHTQYTSLEYNEVELHSETSIYGEAEEQFVEKNDIITYEDILTCCTPNTKGIYLEISEADDFWNHIAKFKRNTNIKIMWEVRTSSTQDVSKAKKVLELIKKVDYYSINLQEAYDLFKVENEDAVIKAIQFYGIPCYLRLGSKGSMVVLKDKYHFEKSLLFKEVIDTTGCGNSSTAASLIGFVENEDLRDIAKMGNISAGYTLLQYGPYPDVVNVRKEARKILKSSKLSIHN
ncbi:MAG: PfkB family carbohydrate kinase [Breznakia sp.]